MSVSGANMLLYQATTMPLNSTTANVGGLISAVQILGVSIGEVHYTAFSTSTGGGSTIQSAKLFCKNTHATDSAQGVQFWGENFADNMPAQGTPFAVITSFADIDTDFPLKIRWMGFDVSGNSQQGENNITADGNLSASGVYKNTTGLSRVELRFQGSGLLATHTQPIDIYVGAVKLGTIPAGLSIMTTEMEIGVSAGLGDSATIALPTTAPPVTMSRANASDDYVASGVTMTAGSNQAIWSRWTLPERAKPSSWIQIPIIIRILAV